MLHLHINLHGVHPQFGQHSAQITTLLLVVLVVYVRDLSRLVLVIPRAVAVPHLGEDEPVLRRPRRSD